MKQHSLWMPTGERRKKNRKRKRKRKREREIERERQSEEEKAEREREKKTYVKNQYKSIHKKSFLTPAFNIRWFCMS